MDLDDESFEAIIEENCRIEEVEPEDVNSEYSESVSEIHPERLSSGSKLSKFNGNEAMSEHLGVPSDNSADSGNSPNVQVWICKLLGNF